MDLVIALIALLGVLLAAGYWALFRDRGQPQRDVVCGRLVPPRAGPTVEFQGRRLRFCGKGCADRFESDPRRWLAGSGDG